MTQITSQTQLSLPPSGSTPGSPVSPRSIANIETPVTYYSKTKYKIPPPHDWGIIKGLEHPLRKNIPIRQKNTVGSSPGARAALKQQRDKSMLALQISVLLFLALMGVSCSSTSISCGTDGESSYVNLENINDKLPNQTKSYAELCNFHATG